MSEQAVKSFDYASFAQGERCQFDRRRLSRREDEIRQAQQRQGPQIFTLIYNEDPVTGIPPEAPITWSMACRRWTGRSRAPVRENRLRFRHRQRRQRLGDRDDEQPAISMEPFLRVITVSSTNDEDRASVAAAGHPAELTACWSGLAATDGNQSQAAGSRQSRSYRDVALNHQLNQNDSRAGSSSASGRRRFRGWWRARPPRP